MNEYEIKNVAVVGAGIMGRGIALSFARGGLQVRLVDIERKILDEALDQIEHDLQLFSEFNLLKEKPSQVKSRVKPTTSIVEACQDCDFVAEAVPEILQLKKQVFAEFERVCREDTILSSNTSSLKISAISEGLHTPGRVVGAHWFNPAHIMPLVEVVAGQYTAKEIVDRTYKLMASIGKKPVLVKKEIAGLIVNRLQAALRREIDHLIEVAIASPEDLDFATKASFGMRLSCIGPSESSDLNGLDTSMRAAKQLYKELDNSTGPSRTVIEKVEKGELGVKTGRGWYDYSGKSKAEILEERDKKLLKRLALFEIETGSNAP